MPKYTVTGRVDITLEAKDEADAKRRLLDGVKHLMTEGEGLLGGATAEFTVDEDNMSEVK